MNLPNALTVLRILLVPLLLYKVLEGNLGQAALVFLLAAVTDGLDGFVARFWNLQTPLGTFLDPLADKLLVTTSYLALGAMDLIPLWLTLTVISRDVIIVLGALVIHLFKGEVHIRPLMASKVTTFLQMGMVLLALLVPAHGSDAFLGGIFGPVAAATALFTVVSGAEYILVGFRALEE